MNIADTHQHRAQCHLAEAVQELAIAIKCTSDEPNVYLEYIASALLEAAKAQTQLFLIDSSATPFDSVGDEGATT